MKSNFYRCIAFLLIIVAAAFLLSSCNNYGELTDTPDRFVKVSSYQPEFGGFRYSTIVDSNTNVMYLEVYATGQFGMTVLLNADGTPMLYDGDY